MSEIITSVEMNFVNNGGGHTATINSVVNSVSVGGGLGALNGALGDRYSFSEETIAKLMEQFIAVEETTAEDSNNVIKKSVKFQDKVSLLLDSHIFLLRGESTSPFDSALPFEGPIYKHSEHPNSPASSVPSVGPKKAGGVITIGKTYSFMSKNFNGTPYSLGYHDKILENGLTYNPNVADADSENSNNLSNYNLLYGYKLSEFKEALDLLGLKVKGLPTSGAIFNYTGKVSAVISSIASSLGYYWYINPFNGEIAFINSVEAIQKIIENPLEGGAKQNIQNASFTQSKLKKVFVNSFVGEIEDNTNENENEKNRKTNFYKIPFESLFNPKAFNFAEYFYALWASKSWNSFQFDAFFFANLFANEGFDWPSGRLGLEPNSKTKLEFSAIKEAMSKESSSRKPFGDRATADWYSIESTEDATEDRRFNKSSKKTLLKPSDAKVMDIFRSYFDTIHKSLYTSRTFTLKEAERREFVEENGLKIYGPFKKQQKLKDIEELSYIRPLLTLLSNPDLTIEDALIKADLQKDKNKDGKSDDTYTVGFTKDYVFLAIKDNAVINKEFAEDNEILNFEYLNENNVEMFFEPSVGDRAFIGFKGGIVQKCLDSALRSQKLFKEDPKTSSIQEDPDGLTTGKLTTGGLETGSLSDPATPVGDGSGKCRIKPIDQEKDVIRVKYRILSNREIDARLCPENNEEEATEGEEDISNEFIQKYFNIINNGADGDPLHPADLISKKGLIGEIKAAEDNVYKVEELPREPLKSSSVTIYGLSIPSEETYDITLSSLSLSLAGGQGITTTIVKSSVDLIPVDEQFVISDFYNKATNMRSTSPRTTAGQRNFLGL
jgi:hypothetical protein